MRSVHHPVQQTENEVKTTTTQHAAHARTEQRHQKRGGGGGGGKPHFVLRLLLSRQDASLGTRVLMSHCTLPVTSLRTAVRLRHMRRKSPSVTMHHAPRSAPRRQNQEVRPRVRTRARHLRLISQHPASLGRMVMQGRGKWEREVGGGSRDEEKREVGQRGNQVHVLGNGGRGRGEGSYYKFTSHNKTRCRLEQFLIIVWIFNVPSTV